jgi:diguanylate cyclase (GGDEF)-like protein
MTTGEGIRRGQGAGDDLNAAVGPMPSAATQYDPVSIVPDATTQKGLLAALLISAKVAVIVSLVEFAMSVATAYLPRAPEGYTSAVIHVVLLAAISTPLILLWVVQPFIDARNAAHAELAHANAMLRREVAERMAAEEKLRTHEYELEMQVEEIDFVKQLMEKQAADAVGLAEDLASQKQKVEESERRHEYLANHDTLTGLPNRRAFEEMLARAKDAAAAANGSVTLVFVDLDNFKAVNDTLGHQRGDALLVEVAERLNGSTRGSDLVARLGGDEFAVVSTQFKDGTDSELRRFAERIRVELAIPVPTADGAIPVSATIGIASYPADAADAETLLLHADRAMYAAKDRGRNCIVLYSEIANADEAIAH